MQELADEKAPIILQNVNYYRIELSKDRKVQVSHKTIEIKLVYYKQSYN